MVEAAKFSTHTVQKGETLWRISQRTGKSVKELKEMNPWIDEKIIPVGASLRIGKKAESKASVFTRNTTTKPAPSTSSKYTFKKGDTLWSVSQKTKIPVATLKKINPTLSEKNIPIGTTIRLTGQQASQATTKNSLDAKTQNSRRNFGLTAKAKSTTPLKKTSFGKITTAPQKNGILTQAMYDAKQGAEIPKLKKLLKSREGKKDNTYIAPEGLATLGYGHLMINKPKFLIAIEKQKLTQSQKNTLVQAALKNPANKEALKASIAKDLQDAINTTGIKDVPTTIGSDLKLSDAQINLLLNSDIKKAQNAMIKDMGEARLKQRTANQKVVALDMYFNVGSNLKKKAPKFVKYFKEGNIGKAQAELDIFSSNGVILGGLIYRNWERMMLLSEDGTISKEASDKLFIAHNKYCQRRGIALASNAKEAERRISKS